MKKKNTALAANNSENTNELIDVTKMSKEEFARHYFNTKNKKPLTVLSPDGISIHPTKTVKSFTEAMIMFKEWRANYIPQGYYSTGRRERIALADLHLECQVVYAKGFKRLEYPISIAEAFDMCDLRELTVDGVVSSYPAFYAANTAPDVEQPTEEEFWNVLQLFVGDDITIHVSKIVRVK